MASRDEEKLRLFGLLAADPDLDLKKQVQVLKVPISTLRKWRIEHRKGITEEKMEKLVNADPIIIDRVAREVAEQIEEVITPEVLVVDDSTDEVITSSELVLRKEQIEIEKQAKIDRRASRFVRQVEGVQCLQTDLQTTAGNLLNMIAERVEESMDADETDSRRLSVGEVKDITASITSLQNAFFNKPTTNIAVTANSNGDVGVLTAFREGFKP